MAATLCLAAASHAGEVLLTSKGFEINAGAAGVYTLGYPRLLTTNDNGLKPQNITVDDSGSEVSMTYDPSGKALIKKQEDGSWLFKLQEIPQDRVKFAFTLSFVADQVVTEALWSFDSKPFEPFPKVKGDVRLHVANPEKFVFKRNGAGFAITYYRKTFTVLSDQRVYGKSYFNLGHILYFPGKKHVPAIDYTLKIEILPEVP